jgi:transposase
VPLATILTGANRHDVTQLLGLMDAIPPIAGKAGRPLQRPKSLYADRAYDSQPHRMMLSAYGTEARIARRKTEHGSGLGAYRWVVERTISWLHQNRRLRIRYERRSDIHEAFLSLGCAMICWNLLNHGLC